MLAPAFVPPGRSRSPRTSCRARWRSPRFAAAVRDSRPRSPPSGPSWSGSATRSAAPRTPSGLLALEKRLIEQAKADRSNAMNHLRLGFLSLRLGELGGQSHYEDAASEFQWAIDLQPTWPYGWYGMGFAEYGVGDSQISFVTGIKTMLGKDALTRSAMAFAKSAEVDPSFDRGLVDLANTALRQRVNIKLSVALDALRRAARRAATPSRGAARARPGRARGRRRRLARWPPSRAISPRGPNRSLGLLEVARTLFLLGRFDGVAPYFEGAASDDSVTVAGYRADLAAIASRQRHGRVRPHSPARGGPST